MGLFSFIKDAGANIFGIGKTEEQEAAENAAKAVELANLKAQNLTEVVTDLGFIVSDLGITVEGDIATIYGEAEDQATRERVILAVGNNAGIASVDDRMTTAIQEPEAQFYTVQSGDSLSKIAKEYYGNAMKYPEIFDANKPMLKDVNKIYPGQVLRIPNLEA